MRPTPVLILLRFTQAFLGRSQPLGLEEGSVMNFFRLVDEVSHSLDQHSATHEEPVAPAATLRLELHEAVVQVTCLVD